MSTDDPITAAADLFTIKELEYGLAKAALFDACAAAVRAGEETAESLARRVPFTAVTIRGELRKRGVAKLKPGPKA